MNVKDVEPIGVTDAIIIAVTFVVFIMLAYVLARNADVMRPFFLMFSSQSWRVIATTVLTVLSVSITLFVIEWAGIVLVPVMFLAAILFLAFSYAKGTIGPTSAVALSAMLALLAFPMIVTIIYRQKTSDTLKTASGVFLALFWIIGFAFSFVPQFGAEVMPMARTRPLLLLLGITMWVVWNIGGDYGVLVNAILTLLVAGVWFALRNDSRILSTSPNGYRTRPKEIAIIATTLIFTTCLNFALMVRPLKADAIGSDGYAKETVSGSLYVFTIVVFAIVLLMFLALVVLKIIDTQTFKSKVNKQAFKQGYVRKNDARQFDRTNKQQPARQRGARAVTKSAAF